MPHSPLISLTGFGPFPGVERNASEELVRGLAASPPPEVAIEACVLSVDFREVARELEAHLGGLSAPPRALVATGVHRGTSLRLERRARREAGSLALDNAGRAGSEAGLDPRWPAELSTDLDLAAIERALEWPDVTHSDDAGGYLCERVYYLTLRHARALGIPALFVHVPGVEVGPPSLLHGPLRRLLTRLGSG